MHNSQVGVMEKHPWPGIPHHLANLFSHGWPITMDCAFCAGRFVFPEGTAVQAFQRIIQKRAAFFAESLIDWLVIFAAVKEDHLLDCLLFTVSAGIPVFHTIFSRWQFIILLQNAL